MFAGGSNGTYLNTVDIYNATSGIWTTANLSIARESLAAASVNNLVMFGGGIGTSYSDRVDISEPCASNTDCDDGIFCNGQEICQDGWCLSSTGNPCLSGGICNQTCNETAKDCFDPEYSSCSDSQFCNGEEICIQGTCIATDIPCDNNTNPCYTCQETLKACYIPAVGTLCPLGDNQCGTCKANSTCTAEPGINCQSVIVQSATTNNVSVIVGSVVGGMVGLALIVFGVFYLQKKQSQSKTNTMELRVSSTLKDVTISEKIGNGAFGEVYHGLINVRTTNVKFTYCV
jgi:hypothetical protein